MGNSTRFGVVGSNDTEPASISPHGTDPGHLYDANGFGHGFVRSKDGAIHTFDVPNSLATWLSFINPRDEMVGYYAPPTGLTQPAFVGDPGGELTTFNPPQSILAYPTGMNTPGQIAGNFAAGLGQSPVHAFLRDRHGEITVYDCAGSVGTFTAGINDSGVITGACLILNSGTHGFIPFATAKSFSILLVQPTPTPRESTIAETSPDPTLTPQVFYNTASCSGYMTIATESSASALSESYPQLSLR